MARKIDANQSAVKRWPDGNGRVDPAGKAGSVVRSIGIGDDSSVAGDGPMELAIIVAVVRQNGPAKGDCPGEQVRVADLLVCPAVGEGGKNIVAEDAQGVNEFAGHVLVRVEFGHALPRRPVRGDRAVEPNRVRPVGVPGVV